MLLHVYAFFCFSNEIEATLNRLKKLEKDLTVKEKELREVRLSI